MYWKHYTGKFLSPKFYNPEDLLQYSDKYFEDYLIRDDNPIYQLKTAGMRHCGPTYCMINSFSTRYVIHYILSGKGWCNGIPINEGDIVFFKSSVPYNFSANPNDPCTYSWITFEGDISRYYLHKIGLKQNFLIYQSKNKEKIYSVLYEMLYVSHSECDADLFMESALLKLLSLSVPPVAEDASASNRNQQNVVKTAVKYISANYKSADFRVSDVSNNVKMNEKYFRKLFKSEMGISIRDYVIKLRIDAAVMLLNSSNYNINEIADLVGYSDYRQFSEIFKKKTGNSPSKFRAEKLHGIYNSMQ